MEFDDSIEPYSVKEEPDSDSECYIRKNEKPMWTSELTMKLIDTYRRDCPELWDTKHYKSNKATRDAKLEYLAEMFQTTTDEICRKIHNLRTQFNSQMRKIKRQRGSGGSGEGDVVVGWEYFEALTFLSPSSSDPPEGFNLELAEFQAKEEVEFGAAARANISQQIPGPSTGIRSRSTTPGTSEAAPSLSRRPSGSSGPRLAAPPLPPLPPSAHPILLPEPDPVPRARLGVNGDECQIFGDFVASELRTLRSDESRKKLKRMIQKAILQVGEEEDVNIISTG